MHSEGKVAVIKTGGKQYRVKEGDVLAVELLHLEGNEVEFKDVLYANDGSNIKIGQPSIPNFFVYGQILGEIKGEKIHSLKYKRSHNQQRKWGHRQRLTQVKITGIGEKSKNKEG